MKQSALDKAIASIEEKIATLGAALFHLREAKASAIPRKRSKGPKAVPDKGEKVG